MPHLRDLTEFYDPNLYLPINGKQYKVLAPPKKKADELRLLIVDKTVTLQQERDEFEALLGPALDEMVADNVPDPVITHAGRTALLHFGGNAKLGAANWHLSQLGELAAGVLPANAKAAASQTTKQAGNRTQRRRR
ncbi:DUF7426 family protein [Rhodococcus opacus]|uniref:DUF7426 family protein n=1 Tax=Rhodococcus opacus TaxID=37919 RepID=UPI001C43ED19|nr:hypothetical protein [Rhodococcus opacus]MBV6758352.1 hypothetical protein [Rhodococcus opacus]